MSIALFWFVCAVVLYTYVGYPGLVTLVGQVRRRRVRQESISPSISLIIAVYNEQETISKRLDNALALEYRPGALQIVVASDGSTDATNAIVSTYEDRGVVLLPLPRKGKIYALKAAVARASGEILVFSDASTFFSHDALQRLVRNFADPEVGGVAGCKCCTHYESGDSVGQGERLYWIYEQWLKRMESITGSVVAADGAIYAIRRQLYPDLVSSAVTDDFAISTSVVEQGYRLVYEPEARSYEAVIASANREFSRKVRLMTRGFRSLFMRRKLLNPLRYGFFSLVFLSHKLLRRLLPALLVLLFVASLLASRAGVVYSLAAYAQMGFYLAALVGYMFRRSQLGHWKPLCLPFFYCMANLAALVALYKVIRGDRIELWQPQRHSPPS